MTICQSFVMAKVARRTLLGSPGGERFTVFLGKSGDGLLLGWCSFRGGLGLLGGLGLFNRFGLLWL